MKIYTKKGDAGQTSLIGGTRVPKHHLRIEAYGTVDELNSYIGVLRDQEAAAEFKDLLKEIQDHLFTLGSHLASDPGKSKMKLPALTTQDVETLEKSIDAMDTELPALQNFVLPGGHPANSFSHVARCVCRRAERLTVQLDEEAPVDPVLLQYLNRLSDWLFAFSRMMSLKTGSEEVPWTPRG
ncbi:UNVERIFIED_CONTAM: hypothetical protein GTU68_010774 [Idotea baltica]|nr:hypothetical protein [Idotea baltica]